MLRTLIILCLLLAFSAPAVAAEIAAEAVVPPVAQTPAPDTPLNQPNTDSAGVDAWVAAAVCDAMTFSAADYKQRLPQAAQYFTKAGWESFSTALQRLSIVPRVAAGKQAMTAQPERPPVLVQEGVLNGVYRWIIALPLQVDYKDAITTQRQSLTLNLVVERTAAKDSTYGALISQFVAVDAGAPSPAPDGSPLTPEDAHLFDYHPPAPVFHPVHADAPLDQPDADNGYIAAWTAAAMTRAETFGFAGYEEEQAAAKRSFTKDGWDSFQSMIGKTGKLRNVVQYQQLLSSIPARPPAVLAQGAKDGVYQWELQAPLVETVRVGVHKVTRQSLVTITVSRVPASQQPHGLAISDWKEAD